MELTDKKLMKKRNIVFVLTDDQGAWAMHNAGNDEIITPNLDYLAEHGAKFENFFCASPVCSPARASVLTGRIPSQHGVHDWLLSGNLDKEALGELKDGPCFREEKTAIPYLDGMICYTDVLAENGYTCALAGKWHLGDSLHPQHGYTKWFTIGRGGCDYFHPDLVENGKVFFENRYITDIITDKALEYLDELTDGETPFCLNVNYTAPHSPWDRDNHQKKYLDIYKDCEFCSVPALSRHPWQSPTAPMPFNEDGSVCEEERRELLRGYYAAITAMDAGVGKLIELLKRKNQLEDTIFVFMADNGMNMGHHGIWGKGNGTFPMNMYDTSVKVPLLISWPAGVKEGQVIEGMYSQYDFMPTILELAGIELPEFPNLPGHSFAPALFGKEDPDRAIYIFDEYGPNRMIRTKEWKLVHRYPYGPDELYHLSEDPEENTNLIADEQYECIRETLMRDLTQWFTKYADPNMDAAKEPVSGFGQLCRPGVYAEGKKVYSERVKFQVHYERE